MIKLILRFLRISAKIFLFLLVSLIFVAAIQYITCPIYEFKEASPFAGNLIYNPYAALDNTHWRKANFQVQSYAWKGITAGRKNTNEKIFEVYKSLGYDIIATSDYQKINKYRCEDPSYLPVYEHGYGIKKNHQVLIGAESILWKDYPFFQTIHNKQHILNLLRKDKNELVYIAHPKLRNAYTTTDMRYLANYDGIEVLNNFVNSFEHWDSALSSGNYITIIGNDDAHDVSNPKEIGYHFTFVNSPSTHRPDIIEALKKGNAFGARIYKQYGKTFEEKRSRIKDIPVLKKVRVYNDMLNISVNTKAKEIRFVGQGGELKEATTNTNEAYYLIVPEDTYIRVEIEFPDQTIFYLNPVCRYDGINVKKADVPEINMYKTVLLRIFGFATLIFIFINYIHHIQKRLRKTSTHQKHAVQ